MAADGDSVHKFVSAHTDEYNVSLFFLCLLYLQRLVPCSRQIMGVFANKKNSRRYRLYFYACEGGRGWSTSKEGKTIKNREHNGSCFNMF